MAGLLSRATLARRAVPAVAFALALPLLGGSAPQRAAPQGPAAVDQQSRGGGAGQGGPQRQASAPLGWEWWKDEAVKKELGLSEMQVRQITRIYDDRSRQLKPFSDDYAKQLEVLDRMTRERQVDTYTYALQVNRVEALRSKLSETRIVMFYSFSRILTPEQNTKLQDIRDKRRGRGGQ